MNATTSILIFFWGNFFKVDYRIVKELKAMKKYKFKTCLFDCTWANHEKHIFAPPPPGKCKNTSQKTKLKKKRKMGLGSVI